MATDNLNFKCHVITRSKIIVRMESHLCVKAYCPLKKCVTMCMYMHMHVCISVRINMSYGLLNLNSGFRGGVLSWEQQ